MPATPSAQSGNWTQQTADGEPCRLVRADNPKVSDSLESHTHDPCNNVLPFFVSALERGEAADPRHLFERLDGCRLVAVFFSLPFYSNGPALSDPWARDWDPACCMQLLDMI